jgi:hypothetical protein
MPFCEIVYVKQKEGNGWKWRPLVSEGSSRASAETYELYYECVTAARARGYQLNVKLKCS